MIAKEEDSNGHIHSYTNFANLTKVKSKGFPRWHKKN